MPWKESCHVRERMRFVARLEDGERMTDLCREFGISRKTGYKIWERFTTRGVDGLFDESRRPKRLRHQIAPEVEDLLLEARRAHPTWGPRKLRAWLRGKHEGVNLPAPSTIGSLLARRGLVVARRRRRLTPPFGLELHAAAGPNEVWCADFKGQFRVGSGSYCYPATITDRYSRFLLACEGLDDTKTDSVWPVFESAFRENGLPRFILTDNGTPFASRGLAGLSRLSVRWLRLGITPQRIEPGHPEQNGQHERMHLVLKQDTTRPASATMLQQQERFDRFLDEYNRERPHEALGNRTPASLYTHSPRPYPAQLPELLYPLHDQVATIGASGHLYLRGKASRQVFLSAALAGQRVGLREVSDGTWLVTFATLDLGVLDQRSCSFAPLDALAPAGERDLPDETQNYDKKEELKDEKPNGVSPMFPV